MNKLSVLLLSAVLAGCASAPMWNPNTADQLTPGVSTIEDAKKLFGVPATTSREAEGVTAYTWCSRGMCTTLAFDADGTLRKY
jgi:hypothetical protein